MPPNLTTRSLQQADLTGVCRLLDATGLFPSSMLDAMSAPYLSGEAPHHWLVADDGEGVAGFLYAEPERVTDGTFNLLAIAVDPSLQRQGVGRAIVRALEERLREGGGRILLVETSALDEYENTRNFYRTDGFREEARIRDFYAEGEDKIVFWKRL